MACQRPAERYVSAITTRLTGPPSAHPSDLEPERVLDERARRWLCGWDETPGIVAVHAPRPGQARVWRRTAPDALVVEDEHLPGWFLVRDRALVAALHPRLIPWERWCQLGARAVLEPGIHVVRLEGGDEDALRYLVLADADSYAEAEAALLDTWNEHAGDDGDPLARSLDDLRADGAVLAWPAEDQYLLLSGRTFYHGLEYDDLRRVQFDLETTGLDERRDRIFMISLSDSTGWRTCLDIGDRGESDERRLLERFVEVIQARDPDVLENHNIFEFDLRFLVRRAQTLGVQLGIGRDGSPPLPTPAFLRTLERVEGFTRWRVAGREVVDTLHAVKRHGAHTHALRRHGLKEVARYFGLAPDNREYVPGPEIWTTFQTDPERVRRYAGDDVREVDGLSRLLLVSTVGLARLVPRRYEQIAADDTAAGLLDPLLLRATLAEGRAVPGAQPPAAGPSSTPATLYTTGVVPHAVRVGIQWLAASLVSAWPAPTEPRPAAEHDSPSGPSGGTRGSPVDEGLRPQGDVVGLFPGLLRAALQRAGDPDSPEAQLAQTCRPYLATADALFGDQAAAAALTRACRVVVRAATAAAEQVGAVPLEMGAESVVLGLPDPSRVEAVLAAMAATLPPGVAARVEDRYGAYYQAAERSFAALHAASGTLVLVGPLFHAGVQERFGERFVREGLPHLLADDPVGLRRAFLATVRRLCAGAVSPDDLCVRITLHRTPAEYRRSGQVQEPYEVLLAEGIKAWRAGERIRYVRDRSGAPRLLRETETIPVAQLDLDHYVQRLRAGFCQVFQRAYTSADFARLFDLEDHGDDGAAVADVRTTTTRVATL